MQLVTSGIGLDGEADAGREGEEAPREDEPHWDAAIFEERDHRLGLLVGVMNRYLSQVRPRLFWWRNGSRVGYRHVSGYPIVGTLLVVAAGLVGFGELPTAAVGLVALAIDNGGLPWYVIATWHQDEMWDA